MVPLLRKIHRCFQARDEIEQRAIDVADLTRQRSLQLIERRASLQWRDRVDEIGRRGVAPRLELS